MVYPLVRLVLCFEKFHGLSLCRSNFQELHGPSAFVLGVQELHDLSCGASLSCGTLRQTLLLNGSARLKHQACALHPSPSTKPVCVICTPL